MAKRNLLFVAILLVLAFLFHTIYTSTIVLWDAYALEIDLTESVEVENSFSISRVNLHDYPLVLNVFDEVNSNGYTVVTFDDGSVISQFQDLIEENNGSLDYGYTYVMVDERDYMVSMISYGGMDDTPEYLYLSWLMGVIAIGLTLSETVSYIRSR